MNLIEWNLPQKEIVLANNEIHIWLCNLNIPNKNISNLEKILSRKELHKAGKFHFQKDKNSFVISRASLKIILSKYTSVGPTAVKFVHNKYGKPFLDIKNDTNISFNLSHSGNFCLIGITKNNKIGVDIEKINKDFSSLEIAKNYFSKKEYLALTKLPSKDRGKAFFYCWTRKEAFIKAEGKGLSIPLDSFDVTISEEEAKIIRINNNININDWQLYNLNVNDEYCAAIVSSGDLNNIKKFYVEDINLVLL